MNLRKVANLQRLVKSALVDNRDLFKKLYQDRKLSKALGIDWTPVDHPEHFLWATNKPAAPPMYPEGPNTWNTRFSTPFRGNLGKNRPWLYNPAPSTPPQVNSAPNTPNNNLPWSRNIQEKYNNPAWQRIKGLY